MIRAFIPIVIFLSIIIILIINLSPREPNSPTLKVDNISYKIVTVENHKFIATQTYGGYWVLAGPIEEK